MVKSKAGFKQRNKDQNVGEHKLQTVDIVFNCDEVKRTCTIDFGGLVLRKGMTDSRLLCFRFYKDKEKSILLGNVTVQLEHYLKVQRIDEHERLFNYFSFTEAEITNGQGHLNNTGFQGRCYYDSLIKDSSRSPVKHNVETYQDWLNPRVAQSFGLNSNIEGTIRGEIMLKYILTGRYPGGWEPSYIRDSGRIYPLVNLCSKAVLERVPGSDAGHRVGIYNLYEQPYSYNQMHSGDSTVLGCINDRTKKYRGGYFDPFNGDDSQKNLTSFYFDSYKQFPQCDGGNKLLDCPTSGILGGYCSGFAIRDTNLQDKELIAFLNHYCYDFQYNSQCRYEDCGRDGSSDSWTFLRREWSPYFYCRSYYHSYLDDESYASSDLKVGQIGSINVADVLVSKYFNNTGFNEWMYAKVKQKNNGEIVLASTTNKIMSMDRYRYSCLQILPKIQLLEVNLPGYLSNDTRLEQNENIFMIKTKHGSFVFSVALHSATMPDQQIVEFQGQEYKATADVIQDWKANTPNAKFEDPIVIGGSDTDYDVRFIHPDLNQVLHDTFQPNKFNYTLWSNSYSYNYSYEILSTGDLWYEMDEVVCTDSEIEVEQVEPFELPVSSGMYVSLFVFSSLNRKCKWEQLILPQYIQLRGNVVNFRGRNYSIQTFQVQPSYYDTVNIQAPLRYEIERRQNGYWSFDIDNLFQIFDDLGNLIDEIPDDIFEEDFFSDIFNKFSIDLKTILILVGVGLLVFLLGGLLIISGVWILKSFI